VSGLREKSVQKTDVNRLCMIASQCCCLFTSQYAQ